MRPPGVPHWTEEECDFLQAFVPEHGHNWVHAARQMSNKFGDRRPYGADMIRKKWRQICLKNGGEPPSTPAKATPTARRQNLNLNWTEVEEEVLISLVDEHGEKWPTVARGLVDRLGEVRKYSARLAKAKWESMPEGRRALTLAAVPEPTTTTPGWGEEHDEYLSMLQTMYPDDWQKMSEIFEKRFEAVDPSVDNLKQRAKAIEMRKPSPSSRRKRVELDSSSDDMKTISEPIPKKPAPAPKSPKTKLKAKPKPSPSPKPRKQILKSRKSITTTAVAFAPKEGEDSGAAAVEQPEARPRSKSCIVQ